LSVNARTAVRRRRRRRFIVILVLVPRVTPLPDDAEAADADERGEVLQQRGAGP
jgi:hypothetical protein